MAGLYLKLFCEFRTAFEAGRVKVILKPGVTVSMLNDCVIGDPTQCLQLDFKGKTSVAKTSSGDTLHLCWSFSVFIVYLQMNGKLDMQQETEAWIKVTKSVTFKNTRNIQKCIIRLIIIATQRHCIDDDKQISGKYKWTRANIHNRNQYAVL